MTRFLGFVSYGVLPALAAAVLLAGCGGASSSMPGMVQGPAVVPTPQMGQPLGTMTVKGSAAFVDAAGHTVYVFDLDLTDPGHTTCDAGTACAQNWPPVAAPNIALPSGFSTISRSDGSKQLAYKGRPLYTFIADARPGDANGDGLNAFGGIWHIARPQA